MGTTTTPRRPLVQEVRGIQMDDEFTSSYRASLGRLVGFFRAKGVPREEAADLANETMVRMLVHLKRHGRERTDLGPLVRTIARNLLIERVRKQAPVLVPLGEDVDVADDELEPIDQLVAIERRDAVRRAIRSLSPRHRHVVGLWMEGRSPAEIARELGVKRNAVDAILHRARRSLAVKLDNGGVLAVVPVLALRARSLARRLSSVSMAVDPGGQTAPAGLAFATMGMAAVLTFGTPATASAGHSPAATAVPATASTSVAKVVASPETAATPIVRELEETTRPVTSMTREFGTKIGHVAGGAAVEIGITERERHDGKHSLLGPILRVLVTDNVCKHARCTRR